MDRGRCRETGVDPEWFFPEAGRRGHDAKLVCAGCEVNTECLQFALDHMSLWEAGRYGIWGGTSRDERVALLTGRVRVR